MMSEKTRVADVVKPTQRESRKRVFAVMESIALFIVEDGTCNSRRCTYEETERYIVYRTSRHNNAVKNQLLRSIQIQSRLRKADEDLKKATHLEIAALRLENATLRLENENISAKLLFDQVVTAETHEKFFS